MNTQEHKKIIVFADHVFMTDEDIKTLSNSCNLIWADEKNDLINILKKENVKVIISEYVPITAKIMDSSKSLEGIIAWGAGFNHINVEEASKRGIYVANARGANVESVAEHTIAMILALSQNLCKTHMFVRNKNWSSKEEANLPDWLIFHELKGKKIGIIGFGAIGTRVGELAKCFGMDILVYDPYTPAKRVESFGAKYTDLDTLLAGSDYVTLHCVLSKETEKMIGEAQFKLMKPTSFIINASRGGVIVEEDLVNALRDGLILGAGLDVFSEEPIDPGNPLLGFDNVVLSPHIAGGSHEALENVSKAVTLEALRILRNEVPTNLVNREQLKTKD